MTDDGIFNYLSDVVGIAKKYGADAADAVYYEASSDEIEWRNGKFENAERSEDKSIGLRVFIGKKQATVSSSVLSYKDLDALAARVVSMAQALSEDEYIGLASPEQLATSWSDLDTADAVEADSMSLREAAEEAEAAGLGVEGVSQSQGAHAAFGKDKVALYTSHGFMGTHSSTCHSLSVSLVTGEGVHMESGGDYGVATYREDMPLSADIGRRAAFDTLRRFNPRKVPTQEVPVIFEPRQAARLLSILAGAINGRQIARGTSFLKDKLGKRLFREGVVVSDDPHRQRGLRSCPFDGEGLPNPAVNFIEDGLLTQWVLDLRSAAQLGLQSNGRASHGLGASIPTTTNLYLNAGSQSPEDLLLSVTNGLLVTSMFGPKINENTGDYSCGVSGVWVENGVATYPVSEITIAGNLLNMFAQLTPANDLTFNEFVNSPTVHIENMTVAGY